MIVRAPGKLMICGEYSVLGPDAEALAMAVGPGVEIEARPADRWTLVRPEVGALWTEGTGEVPADLRFVHAAVRVATAALGERAVPARLEARTLGATGTGARKPGVGGSASSTVAAVGAVLASAGDEVDPDRVLPLARAAHTHAQGGRGSGYDIATIATGGLVHWRKALLAGPSHGTVPGDSGSASPMETRALDWPDGLHVLAGYTGHSAGTTTLVGRFEARVREDPSGELRRLTRLGRAAAGVIDAFADADVAAILAHVKEAARVFEQWDRIGAHTAAVGRLIALAESVGAAAKVSGAGGGDSVLAFAQNAETIASVRRIWERSAFVCLSLDFSALGVTLKKAHGPC